MSELEDIKKRKLAQLQNQAMQEQNEKQEFLQQVNQLESVVKTRLTKEALSRFGNLKTAHPEKASRALTVIANIIQKNNSLIIDDKMLTDILLQLTPQKKAFKFKGSHTGKI